MSSCRLFWAIEESAGDYDRFENDASRGDAGACVRLGAQAAINYRQQDFAQEVKRLAEGRGADVILDMVGGETVARNISTLASDGRLVFIAFMTGSRVDIGLMRVMLKHLRVTGSTLRAQSPSQKAEIAMAIRSNLWPHFEVQRCRPVLFATFPLAQAAEAHRLLETNTHIGKIVLRMQD